MELVGPTLTLRYATEADAPALQVLGADDRVTRFFSWGPYATVAEPLDYIGGLPGERERGERLDFLIVTRTEDEPIGVTGLSEFSRRDRRAVIGTWLTPRRWGTGANRECKAIVTRLAFAVLGLERLGAYADVENGRSQSALLGQGFQREGVLRRWHRHGERVRDVVVMSMLRQEWERSSLTDVPVDVRGVPPAPFLVAASSAAAPS